MRRRITIDFVGKYQGDYFRILNLAKENNITSAEVIRRGMRLAIRWDRLSFWEKVKRCFFNF